MDNTTPVKPKGNVQPTGKPGPNTPVRRGPKPLIISEETDSDSEESSDEEEDDYYDEEQDATSASRMPKSKANGPGDGKKERAVKFAQDASNGLSCERMLYHMDKTHPRLTVRDRNSK